MEGLDTNKGSSHEALEIEFTGKEIKIGLNIEYLKQIISHVEGKEINIGFDGSRNAIEIKSVEGNSFEGILMPLNL